MSTSNTPTAAQRIAEHLRHVRAVRGWNQKTAAAVLTALGLPTKTSTIARIESGKQDVTLEQALLIAQLDGEGLAVALQAPYSIGGVEVPTKAAGFEVVLGPLVDAMLDDGDQPPDWRVRRVLVPVRLAEERERAEQISAEISATSTFVKRAAMKLYGHSVGTEMVVRSERRMRELDERPEVGSATWAAYRSHALRAITAEIADFIDRFSEEIDYENQASS